MVALKRKHDALQRQNTDVNELLGHIKSVSQPDAYRIIEFLRSGEDAASALNFARALPTPGAPAELLLASFRTQNVEDGSLTPVPYGGYSSDASIALDLNAGRTRRDTVPPQRQGESVAPSNTALPSFDSLVYDARPIRRCLLFLLIVKAGPRLKTSQRHRLRDGPGCEGRPVHQIYSRSSHRHKRACRGRSHQCPFGDTTSV